MGIWKQVPIFLNITGMRELFKQWIADGNVIKFNDGYGTQDALYRNRLKDKKELYKYFKKEFGN